ncbi:hypothetical protein ACFWWT_37660 [Streptomyces sp. NPDC058676]|uniref:hypothetical protein n=1 Tax=unclassified Streptomyces TaxID=2593676 RepID=UPI00364CD4FC
MRSARHWGRAIRLGAGWGISSEPWDDGHWTEQTWRVFEAVDYRWSGDLIPVARLGQLVGRHVESGGQDRIAAADALLTGWFRDAILEFLPTPASVSGTTSCCAPATARASRTATGSSSRSHWSRLTADCGAAKSRASTSGST